MPRPGGAIRAPLLDASAEASAPTPAPASPTANSGAGSLRLEPPAEPPAPLADGARLENVVVGAGPAGLLAACLLAKAGTPVVVVDARERPTEFYGSFPVVLNMRGLTALLALGEGIAERFRAAGRAVRQLHVVPDNKTVAQVDTHGTCIMRDTAAGMLLSIADELGVPIHWNTKLLAIDLPARQCTFEQGDGSVSLSAGKLIAADGNWSKVRRICEEQAGLQVETEECEPAAPLHTTPHRTTRPHHATPQL